MPHPGGRPTHLTQALIERIAAVIAEDDTLTLVAACQTAGVCERVAYRWQARAKTQPGTIYAQLAERVEAAREAARAAALQEAKRRVRERFGNVRDEVGPLLLLLSATEDGRGVCVPAPRTDRS
jgi:hypothetical protein